MLSDVVHQLIDRSITAKAENHFQLSVVIHSNHFNSHYLRSIKYTHRRIIGIHQNVSLCVRPRFLPECRRKSLGVALRWNQFGRSRQLIHFWLPYGVIQIKDSESHGCMQREEGRNRRGGGIFCARKSNHGRPWRGLAWLG